MEKSKRTVVAGRFRATPPDQVEMPPPMTTEEIWQDMLKRGHKNGHESNDSSPESVGGIGICGLGPE